jgi:hypothetical protein
MGKIGEQVSVVFIAIIGVATLAVILSKNANTTGVIQAASQGFSQSLAAALSPITGGSTMGSFGGL